MLKATLTRMADNAAMIYAAATGRWPSWADPTRIARARPRLDDAARDVNALGGTFGGW